MSAWKQYEIGNWGTCPKCGSHFQELGILGERAVLRCINCSRVTAGIRGAACAKFIVTRSADSPAQGSPWN